MEDTLDNIISNKTLFKRLIDNENIQILKVLDELSKYKLSLDLKEKMCTKLNTYMFCEEFQKTIVMYNLKCEIEIMEERIWEDLEHDSENINE